MTSTLDRGQRQARMVDEPGVRYGVANGVLVALLVVAAALPLDLDQSAAVAVVGAAVAASSLPPVLAIALGIESWAFFTGFFEHQYGVLTLGSHDLRNLLAFAVCTMALARAVRALVGRTAADG